MPRTDSRMTLNSASMVGSKNSLDRRNLDTPDKYIPTSSTESEIDALTDLLMTSLRKNEVFFGNCC